MSVRSLALLMGFFLAFVAAAQSSGPLSPGATGNNSSVGTTNWTSPGNAVSNNGSYASVSAKGITRYLTASTFGFSITGPAGIAGIQVDVDRSTTANSVALLDAWSTGTSKTISGGTNRCLIVAYAQENGLGIRDVTAMSYGGRAMTFVGQQSCGTTGSFMGRIEVWMLLESDIAAAVGSAIVPTYAGYTGLEYCELFSAATFQHVDQGTPITSVQGTGAVSPPSTTNPHQLGAAITTLAGSMAVNVVTEGNNTSPAVANGASGTYTINSGYTEGTDVYFANTGAAPTSGACFQTAHKAIATNGTEQPSCTFNGTPNRWAMIGFTLQRARELDYSVRLMKGGTIGGTDLANTTSWPTSDAYVNYGGAGNLWGQSWTIADINATGFGVVLAARVANGTARVDHVRVTVTYYSTLPVELVGFDAKPEGRTVELQWATASESNNNHFTVQRGRDALNFEDIGELPGAGNSQTMLLYNMVDEQPLGGTSYYRLVQADDDGTTTTSEVVAVNFEQWEATVYPNPTADGGLTFFDAEAQRLAVAVYDDAMHLVRQAAVVIGEPVQLLNDLPDGSYTLLVRNGTDVHATRVMRQSQMR
ncbi:MAG: T9SS type A sorting domain-containing protein [Flavobacteriales bacterium]